MNLRNYWPWLAAATLLLVVAGLALHGRQEAGAPDRVPGAGQVTAIEISADEPVAAAPSSIDRGLGEPRDPNKLQSTTCDQGSLVPGIDEQPQDDAQIAAHMRAWREQLDGYVAALDQSRNPEHAMVAANLTADGPGDERIQTLFDALAQSPHDGLLALAAFSQCERNTHPACPAANAEALLIDADAGNGAMWLRLAGHFIEQERDSDALDALHSVASAPFYDTYTARSIAIANDALAAVTDLPYGERVMLAMGAASATPIPNFSAIAMTCRSRAAASPAWRESCLAAGQRMERDAQDVLPKLIGIALQRVVFDETGREAQAAACLDRSRELNERVSEPARYSFDALAASNPKILERYLDEWAGNGELAAARYAVAAAQAAIERGEHTVCPGPEP